MILRDCSWNPDLVQALRSGHYPQGCDPELRNHVPTCRRCSDLALVAQAFQKARSASLDSVPLVHPGLLWWRAQFRQQREVVGRISRPIAIAQTFAWGVSLLVALVFVVSQYRSAVRWLSWSRLDVSRTLHSWALAAASLQWNSLLVIPVVGILVLLSGVVLYLCRERE